MKKLQVHPIRQLDVNWQIPGDKSISHRAAMLGGLAKGTSLVTDFLPSHDCMASLRAMQALGAQVETIDETSFLITGNGFDLKAPLEPIDCGNSGTTMRLLSGILAGQQFTSRLFGDHSLNKRPMKRIADPLAKMGATVECEGEQGRPPLQITGGKLSSLEYTTPIPSAQLKSCLLLAGLQAEGKTVIRESAPSRDHTERMLKHLSAAIRTTDLEVNLYGGQPLLAQPIAIPGDFSSAAFWIVAAACLPGSRARLQNVGLNPTRTALLNVLCRMGATFSEHLGDQDWEPKGTLSIHGSQHLIGTEVSGDEIPNLIDEIPIMAVAAALAHGTTVIKDAEELRVKESDRLAAIATNLKAFGVSVTEKPDGLIIEGGCPIKAASVESYGDHRIAMSAAILGLFADGTTHIHDTDCISTSYPTFFDHLNQVLKRGKRPIVSAPLKKWSRKFQGHVSELQEQVSSASKTSMNTAIAIDGPAASGKSTVARLLAKKLNFIYVDTGAMYRTFAWLAQEKGIDASDRGAIKELIDETECEATIEDGTIRLLVNGVSPGEEIRGDAVNQIVSKVAAVPELREYLVNIQRSIRLDHPVVMEGRDIGTVVFTDTKHKYFIDADEKVRQARREAQGQLDLLSQRDKEDRTRAAAPLTKAADAQTIDSTDLSPEEIVDQILEEIKEHGLSTTSL
ncbi:MAG: 3-phosphoshikimate 1-carboxyvinyltransferase [Verrucomicrobiota bacterium]